MSSVTNGLPFTTNADCDLNLLNRFRETGAHIETARIAEAGADVRWRIAHRRLERRPSPLCQLLQGLRGQEHNTQGQEDDLGGWIAARGLK